MDDLLRLEGVTLADAEGRNLFRHLDWHLPVGGRAVLHSGVDGHASAFLRLCAGLLHPEAGHVLLAGTPLGPYTFGHPFLARGGLGWVPTEGGLLVNLSLRANLALPLRFLRGHARLRAETLAQEGLERWELASRADLRPHALAPRERWLGALLRAELLGPSLWLVDRPPGKLGSREQRLVERHLQGAAADPAIAFIGVGNGWQAFEGAEFHLEGGRLLPGGP